MYFSIGLMAGGEQTTTRAVAAKIKNPVATSAASVASGQVLYRSIAGSATATPARGDSTMAPKNMKPSNLTDATWDRGSSDGEIFGSSRKAPARVQDEGSQGQDHRRGHLEPRELRSQPRRCAKVDSAASALALRGVPSCVTATGCADWSTRTEQVQADAHDAAVALGHVLGLFTGRRTLSAKASARISASGRAAQPFAFSTRSICRRAGLHRLPRGRRARAARRAAGVNTCMICHSQIATDRPLIQQLTAMQEKGLDLAWQRVYDFTREAHVRFEHAPHIRAEVGVLDLPRQPGRADRGAARREHGHGVLRELPQTEAGVERLPDVSLLIRARVR